MLGSQFLCLLTELLEFCDEWRFDIFILKICDEVSEALSPLVDILQPAFKGLDVCSERILIPTVSNLAGDNVRIEEHQLDSLPHSWIENMRHYAK